MLPRHHRARTFAAAFAATAALAGAAAAQFFGFGENFVPSFNPRFHFPTIEPLKPAQVTRVFPGAVVLRGQSMRQSVSQIDHIHNQDDVSVNLTVELEIRNQRELWATGSLQVDEAGFRVSSRGGSPDKLLYTAPAGATIARVQGDTWFRIPILDGVERENFRVRNLAGERWWEVSREIDLERRYVGRVPESDLNWRFVHYEQGHFGHRTPSFRADVHFSDIVLDIAGWQPIDQTFEHAVDTEGPANFPETGAIVRRVEDLDPLGFDHPELHSDFHAAARLLRFHGRDVDATELGSPRNSQLRRLGITLSPADLIDRASHLRRFTKQEFPVEGLDQRHPPALRQLSRVLNRQPVILLVGWSERDARNVEINNAVVGLPEHAGRGQLRYVVVHGHNATDDTFIVNDNGETVYWSEEYLLNTWFWHPHPFSKFILDAHGVRPGMMLY